MRVSAIISLSLALCGMALPAKRGSKSLAGQVITSCSESGTAALTFDDGPSAYIMKVSDDLANAGGKGTFFLNGQNYGNIYDRADGIKYAISKGHQIASHTWSHAHLATLNRDQLVEEFDKTDAAIRDITGLKPAFMRPPYGEYSDLVLDVARERGQAVVIWDFDSQDSVGATPQKSEELYDELVENHPDSVLALNHDVKEDTSKIVAPYAIKVLKQAGYRLVTVAECLGEAPYQSGGKYGKGTKWYKSHD